MDTGLQALLSWQFILFSLGIFSIVWLFRTIVEYIAPKITQSGLWDKLILPVIPCFLGLVIAYLAKNYAYPDGISSFSGREMFGLVAGMFSGLTYQVVKGMLKNRIQSYLTPIAPPPPPPVLTSTPPPPPAPVPVAPITFQTNTAPSYPVDPTAGSNSGGTDTQ